MVRAGAEESLGPERPGRLYGGREDRGELWTLTLTATPWPEVLFHLKHHTAPPSAHCAISGLLFKFQLPLP